ncbi:MAG: SMC-Scp complex subunit ScpB [Nitrospirae bacterium]|nr:SMC-Scp complex subunit ScpB [Nitrospirota bacterium]
MTAATEEAGLERNSSPLSGLKGIVEAILFVSGEPISVDRLQGVVEGVSRAELMSVLRALQADHAVEGRGLQVVEVAGGFQIATRPDCAPWIKRLEKAKAGAKLSRSSMETLAIVAYKQPLVRAEIEQIRGVDTAGVLKTLLDRRLIRIVGRKDIPGRPIMYGTTKQFLQAFGLKDLASLPALRDIKYLKEAEQFILPNVDPEEEASRGGTEEAVGESSSAQLAEAVAQG